jgi:hypothetical protein
MNNYRSVDYGVTWTEINVGIVGSAQQFVSSGTNLYARTYGGFFWSPVNGDYWIAINSGITKPSGASTPKLELELITMNFSGYLKFEAF